MIQSEYIRNLNCNYERILLDKKPEENRYQYCIVTRGGIRGLLPCSLRYINGQAYLYYDISSTQSVAQLYGHKAIGRQWVKDFLWGMRRIKQELSRFLLDDVNLLWYPEQIFQDLEKNEFYFLYVPYYEEESGFDKLLDYLVEHIDYEDEELVECVYKMHEQFRLLGNVYLTEKIFEDGKLLEASQEEKVESTVSKIKTDKPETGRSAADRYTADRYTADRFTTDRFTTDRSAADRFASDRVTTGRIIADQPAGARAEADKRQQTYQTGQVSTNEMMTEAPGSREVAEKEQDIARENKRGIRYFLDGKRKKQKEERDLIHTKTGRMMQGYAVCEETTYKAVPRGSEQLEEQREEIGRTVYMEEYREEPKECNGLFDENGKEVLQLNGKSIIIGKKKDEADCVLEDSSVSRMHARITKEKDCFYLEDLNSTNGTWKNGIRLQPYEKRRMEKEDEIKLGKVVLFYR